MKSDNVCTAKFSLEEVRGRLESFREERTGRRIPEELWDAAARLCEHHSVNRVSKALGLNYMDLRKRVKVAEPKPRTAPSPGFLELDLKDLSGAKCLVEMEATDGAKLRIEGAADLLEIVRLFWGRDR